MNTSNHRPIVLTGSIAIDRIMSFGGQFSEQLHPEKLANVSVSIFLDKLQDTRGGVAANIAYSLAKLGEHPVLLGSVGPDATIYLQELSDTGVDTAFVYESTLPTASFNVITDAQQNQIGGFYPGAMFDSAALSLEPWQGKNPLVVVSPHDPKSMRQQVAECKKFDFSLCYDIGQQVTNASGEDMRAGVEAAEVLILNDYEFSVLSKKTGLSADTIKSTVPIVLTTHGKDGSVIEGSGVPTPIRIGIAQPANVADPTGAGDAYRAGFLYGYTHDWGLQAAAQLGAVCASYNLEVVGTQNHQFGLEDITQRYTAAFGEAPPFRHTT